MIESKRAAVLPLIVFAVVLGCRHSPPSGSPINATPLGMVLDEANRIQEDNAEAAKFIVYVHEFELNQPFKLDRELIGTPQYKNVPEELQRGFRLNLYGQDHVRQIARHLQQGTFQQVVVERSESSRAWMSKYRYPVHWNPTLDEHRRKLVVQALELLGVERANELVHIAPAFPFGLDSDEAARAYQSSRINGQGGGRNTGGGGGGGYGGGGYGGGGFGGGGFGGGGIGGGAGGFGGGGLGGGY